MRNILILFILTISFSACKTDESSTVIKTLIFNKDIQNKPVILAKNTLPKMPEFFLLYANEKEIPYQLDDLNGNGEWDEIFLLVDFKASEKTNFTYKATDKQPTFKDKVAITFAKKDAPHDNCFDATRVKPDSPIKASDLYQMEGPAWENDVVGFRNYYDQRNVMDIFGKQTTELSLAKAGIDGQNYHELDDWGMDILKVGSSLGAGGIALAKNDSIYRIGNPETSRFKLKIDGPLRAIFSLIHNNFRIDSNLYHITQEISIHAGTNYYESTVTIDGLTGSEKLVTGIVNLHSDTLHLLENKNRKTYIMATYDKQSENGAMLGMALSFDKNDFHSRKELPKENSDLTNSYAVFLRIQNRQPVTYKFIAAWETQDKRMGEEKYFLESLTQ